MARARGPAGSKRKLGLWLKEQRTKAGFTGKQVANELGCGDPKVFRMEGGHAIPSKLELDHLFELFQVDDQRERELIRQLAADAKSRHWTTDFESVMPPKFDIYVGREEDATSLRVYETHLMHGLLQIEGHMRPLLAATNPQEPAEDVERLVEFRTRRQLVLTREPDPLNLWVVMDETVVRRPIGGTQVHREQLQHLLKITERPNVNIQIIPESVGAHAGLSGPFTILDFEPDEPEMIYIEGQGGNLYLDKAREIRRHKQLWNHIVDVAMSTAQSKQYIKKVMEDLPS
ncbi:helix-turn-helix transcriptional regulator [Nocardiopsis sp. Huas11]|uniref:helix-turn-helix domain-containing protein n=1 Tax=Nocardiopsis sp. Huas11 TaxID=2183912 RepID=UPI000EB2D38A|nr:helix-turn-helix transcriptional regulator [Nocardiopsis sp. Huas11]